ncbi:MAG: hypothetical protein WA740_14830 [Candidatus Binataceae bacterium]
MKKHPRSPFSRLAYLVFVLCIASGCSVYMEATRPTPVDLATFTPGQSRGSVSDDIGAPVTATKNSAGEACDLHLLYITGYGTPVKVPIAVVETAADFFTAGLAEIVLSPTESLTRNEKKRVWFCYKNDSLASVTVETLKAETRHTSADPGATAETSVSAWPTSSPAAAPAASPSPAP